MEKIFHVFVSSTYLDLKEERKRVSDSIARARFVPEGMEIFPASSQSQMDFIQRVIDRCDYYVLILAGRYGSMAEDGISFTEKEFLYAQSKDIPVLAFLHHDIGKLQSENVESDPEAKQKLDAFKNRVKANSIVDFWSNPDELATKALAALAQSQFSHPGIGWIRARHAASEDLLREINELRKENEQLKSANQLNAIDITDVKIADLDEKFTFYFSYGRYPSRIRKSITIPWRDIIRIIGPNFRSPSFASQISKAFERHIMRGESAWNFVVDGADKQTILAQMEVLGIIKSIVRETDKGSFVTEYQLTQYGHKLALLENLVKSSSS